MKYSSACVSDKLNQSDFNSFKINIYDALGKSFPGQKREALFLLEFTKFIERSSIKMLVTEN